MSVAASTHIEIDEQGAAWITGTKIKVIEVVLDKLAHGWGPEEIQFQHPHLSLAQIHAAFTYYYDNEERLNSEIERRRRDVEALAAESAGSPLRQKLLALRKPR